MVQHLAIQIFVMWICSNPRGNEVLELVKKATGAQATPTPET
ncbi:hypothetical protein [Peribacillus simplex]|nr:hypothetical protein [Peribacillus simplex]